MPNKYLIIGTILFTPIVLIYIIRKRILKKRLVNKILSDGEEDFKITASNIALSISKSKELYKDLITKAHPDNFPNDPIKQDKATKISAMLTEAKRNYSKLQDIKVIIEKELR